MSLLSLDEDRKIAQTICDDIKNGNPESLNQWFAAHYDAMYRTASYRLFDKTLVNEILNNFYIEISSGNAFCLYRGLNGCSLKSYIIGRLQYRKRHTSQKLKPVSQSNGIAPGTPSLNTSSISLDDVPEIHDDKASTEENMVATESDWIVRGIVLEALDRLSADPSTCEDALLVRWHLDELTYKVMAVRLLAAKNAVSTEDALQKESARIRKRFTRPGGSLSLFEAAVHSIMKEKDLSVSDLSFE